MSERSDIVRDSAGFEVPDVHSSSVEYAERFGGSIGRWLLQIQNGVTSELLPDHCTDVLDAGGGHGQNIGVLSQRASRMTILGSDEDCGSLIRTRLVEDKIEFLIGPLTQIPVSDRQFDCSLSYRMLTHLMDWQIHIAELCRVSEKTVLVEFPVRKGFNAFSSALFSLKKNVEKNTRPYTLFDEKTIVDQFQQHGFILNARRAQFFWPMALHRLHKNATLARFFEWFPRVTSLTQVFGSPVVARFDRKAD